MPSPPQPPPNHSASLGPYPLLSFVSYNHDILKLRLSRLHIDFLYNYKQQTERTVDDNRRSEFTRGHSIDVAGFHVDTYPVRKVWARLLDGQAEKGGVLGGEGKEEEVKEEEEEDEKRAEVERAKHYYATVKEAQQPAVRAQRVPQLGLSHNLFRTEQERIDEERDEKELTAQRLARKRARKEQWRSEIKAAIDRATRREEPTPLPATAKEEIEVEPSEDGVQLSTSTDAQEQPKLEPTTSASSPPPITPARPTPSPTTTNRSPSPTTFLTPNQNPYSSSPTTAPTSSAIPSLCEECGSRIESMWSQCDFCGFDPLLSEGEEEEAGGGRRGRKKRGRAARVEKLMAASALQEKKAKSQQEMNKLMETMSPWEMA